MRVVIAAILLSAALAGCDEAKQGDKADSAAPQPTAPAKSGEFDTSRAGAPAPALVLEAADGTPFRLGARRGMPTLVNLWATWCAPCVTEMPALDRLAQARGDSLLVVGVSQDLDGWDRVRPFVAKARLRTMTIVLDREGKLAAALGAGGLPLTVLYDADGREIWRVNGPREWDEPGGFVGR